MPERPVEPPSDSLSLIGALGVPGVPEGCPFDQLHACSHTAGHHVIHLGDWDLDMDETADD